MVRGLDTSDTIAAISTPLGEGGIAVIRISGPSALAIADHVFRAPKGEDRYLASVPSHTVHFGLALNQQGEPVDEVLTLVMRAPRTYTREDVVEIHCHGGIISVRAVLQSLLEAGARLAEPGEFTKRAYLNGRIDLVQAEAVIDIIRAKTEASQHLALSNLSGKLSYQVRALRERLLQALMYLEASIDFPEDEIPPLEQDLGVSLGEVKEDLTGLIASANTGRIYREGLATVIAGKPNVGKSSLLNALLDVERAIVTHIPGTTRDLLEEYVNLQGLPLKIIDTAGIRATTDEVEKIGVTRSQKAIVEADIVLFLVDPSTGINGDDQAIAERLSSANTIMVATKQDLGVQLDSGSLEERFGAAVSISAFEKQGLDRLKEAIIEKAALVEVDPTHSAIVTNLRHVDALRRALGGVESAAESIALGMPVDFVTIDLHEVVGALGEVTGDTAGDDLVNRIFESFCIGK